MKKLIILFLLVLSSLEAFSQVVPTPIPLTTQTLCVGSVRVYGPQTIQATETYTWQITPAVPFSIIPGTNGAQISVTWPAVGTYTITQTADNGMCSNTFSNVITVVQAVPLVFTDVTQCLDDLDVVLPGSGCTYTPQALGLITGNVLTAPGIGVFPVNISCVDPTTGCPTTGVFTLTIIGLPGSPIYTDQ
jgi:hypothetical protein